MSKPSLTSEEMASLLEALPASVTLVDHDRCIRYLNRFGPGYDESVLGADVLDFVPPENRDAQAALLAGVIESGEPRENVVEVAHADGRREWHEAVARPIPGRDGKVWVAIVSRDVTDQIRTEREFEKLRSLLPVCSWCNRIRTERGEWRSLEHYVASTSESRVTHGMCPDCERKLSDADPADAEESA